MTTRIEVGQHGQVTFTKTATNEWEARVKARMTTGTLVEVTARDKRKPEAERKCLAKVAAKVSDRSPLTVADLVTKWLAVTEGRTELAPSTLRTYRSTVTNHLAVGPISATPIADLTVLDMHEYLRVLSRKSHPTAKMVRKCLGAAFDVAVLSKWVPLNPVRLVPQMQAPRKRQPAGDERDTRRAFTVAERAVLLAYADADDYAQRFDMADLIAFMAGTGVRIGEACALRWECVDLDTGLVVIRATTAWVMGRGTYIQEDTKSTAGRRTLTMPAWLVERMRNRDRSTPVVFPSPNGMLRDSSNTQHSMRKVLDGAGLPWATSHTLRRTAATLMDDAGKPMRVISNQLGHARVSITQDLYLDRRRAVTEGGDVL